MKKHLKILTIVLCSSLALAQLVNQRPITSSAQLLTEVSAAKGLTVVASKLSPQLLNKFFFQRRDFESLTLITDPEGFQSIDPYCHVIRFQYFKRIYVLPRLPQDGIIKIDRPEGSSLIQGPMVIGQAGETKLLEGEPMVRNIAIQLIDPLLQNAVFQYGC